MVVANVSTILKNIVGFAAGNTGKIEHRHNDLWHWFKHCVGFLGDTPHMLTLQDYLRLGRDIGTKAATNVPGTFIKLRDNGEILVYWESAPGQRGIFMVVRPLGRTAGEMTTLFSPDEGKRYFELQGPIFATFH
jgi:hypothetical protein